MKSKGTKKVYSKQNRDKNYQQKLRTFNTSQLSLLDDKNHLISSASDLGIFKNQSIARKRANNSALSQYGQNQVQSKPASAKSKGKKKKKTTTNNKQTKSKPKLVMEQYEKVKYKESNSNSEIVFSNDETKRSSAVGKDISLKSGLYLHQLSNQSKYDDSNLILRVSIKREYVRKVQAAVKIQKVFRGYMTRKILLKYVVDQEIKLQKQHQKFSSSLSSRINRSNGSTFRECEDFTTSIFEQNKSNLHQISNPCNFQGHSSQNQDEEFEQMKRVAKEEEKKRQSQYYQNEDEDQSESDDGGEMVYRHQNPIYSHQEIGDFLGSSSDEDEEEEEDAYEPDIIFETNEEYLESRKSSLQNKGEPVNRLSNKGIAQILNLRTENKDIFQIIQNENLKNYDINPRKSSVSEDQLQQIQQDEEETLREEKNRIKQDLTFKRTQVTEQNEQIKEETEDIQNHEKTVKYNQIEILKGNQKTQKKVTTPPQQISEESQSSKSKSKSSLIQQKTLKSGEISSHRCKLNDQNHQENRRQGEIKENKNFKKIQDFQLKDTTQVSGARKFNSRITHEDLNKYLDEFEESQKQKSHSRKSHSRSGSGVSSNSQGSSNYSRNSSINHEEVLKLKQQFCESWEEVIRMVNSQIKKNNESNGEMMNFMNKIMEISQKNKEILGSTREMNVETDQHTTPTSMNTPMNEKYESQKIEKSFLYQSQKKQEDTPTKFFKKKQLKIDIIDEIEQDKVFQGLRESNSFKKKSHKDTSSFVLTSSHKKQGDSCPVERFNYKNKKLAKGQEQGLKNNNIVPHLQSTTNKLKNFFSSNLQIQDQAILEILKMREDLLQKRESEELVKLNNELNGGKLQQGEFLHRLQQMSRKFSEQKEAIDNAKKDITRGYQAANDLVKQYFYDVRRMGIKLAVSRSQDNLRYKLSSPLIDSQDLIIDQLTPKSTPKQIKQMFEDHQIEQNQNQSSSAQRKQQSEEDSEIQFTEEQLKRFRKAATFNLELNQLNGNMTTISDDFIKQQQGILGFDNSRSIFLQMSPEPPQKKQSIPIRQTYHLSEQKIIASGRSSSQIDALVQSQIDMLAWEFACELIIRPTISDKFMDRSHLVKPGLISQEERQRFIGILTENLPDKFALHQKLNQKITPMPGQILKCMRLDFSEDDQEEDDENYQEISKYEFVISQEICIKSVTLFKNQIDQKERIDRQRQQQARGTLVPFDEIRKWCPFAEKLQRFINQRERFLTNRKQHTKDLRWEVLNIQLHCIFDSWNEEIIKLCSMRSGFSGIGLNQLSLSMIDHNKPIALQRSQQIIQDSKKEILQILNDETDLNVKILKDNFEEMCEHDSSWIFYADEALSYGLELVYLIQEDIYTQMAKEWRKMVMKEWL